MDLLLIAAIVPPLFLLYQIYKMDKIEREPLGLIIKLLFFGVLSVIPTAFVETVLNSVIVQGLFAGMTGVLVRAIEYFICVALVEEGFKYLFLKLGSWRNRNFDYCFDAVVYSVAVSLGFALFENIGYVSQFGIQVAGLRAVTAIPGHCIFGIFMGHYYGLAKMAEADGNEAVKRSMLKKALWVPILLHGFYDFAASSPSATMTLVFFAFIIVVDVIAYRQIKAYAAADTRVNRGEWW